MVNAAGCRVHIVFKFVDGAWGGGNQFLKALRSSLTSLGAYAERPCDADAILFNSHHELRQVEALRRRYPEKAFIHRVDGPINVVRGNSREIDASIFGANERIADGTVFQSQWSKDQCLGQGMREPETWSIIHNAPDPKLFHTGPSDGRSRGGRIRLIAASWSTNAKKGFDIYEHLDKELDRNRFEMTYVGNTPVAFANIRHLQPLPSPQLAEEFRNHDIFVSASLMEACSNAIVEAMNCGLVPVVRNNSSQPELAGDPDLVFDGKGDILQVLDRVGRDLDRYRRDLRPARLEDIAGQYLGLCERALARPRRKIAPKVGSRIVDFFRSALTLRA